MENNLHLTPMYEAFQIAVAGRQLTAQGARGAGAEHHQGPQHRDWRDIGMLGACRTACRGGLGKFWGLGVMGGS